MMKMKKITFLGVMLSFLVVGSASAQRRGPWGGPRRAAEKQVPYDKKTFQGGANPYLPLWEHLPDGEPRVFEDPDNPGKYRIYIIGSHDLRLTSYCGPDIRAWSAPVEDLSSWRDEGPIFTYPIDGQWDVMYAPTWWK